MPASGRCRRAAVIAALAAAHGGTPAAPSTAAAQGGIAQAEAALADWLLAHSTRHELRPLVTMPADASRPSRVRPLPDTLALAPRMTVWLEQPGDRGGVRVLPVAFAVRAWGPA